MYLRVRPPRGPSRALGAGDSTRESARFNALLFDCGWWSSRGVSRQATIASQEECVNGICDHAQLVQRLCHNQNVLVVTQGTAGSGKSHLLLGPVVGPAQLSGAENHSAEPLTPHNGHATEHVLPSLVHSTSSLDASALMSGHGVPVPRSFEYGVLHRCAHDILKERGFNEPRRLFFSAVSFSPAGWLDLLNESEANTTVATVNDATRHAVESMDQFHVVLTTALARGSKTGGASAATMSQSPTHVVFQLELESLDSRTIPAKALFVDLTAPPAMTSRQLDRSTELFHAHTDYVVRSALLGTLESSSPLVSGWLAPWETMWRRCLSVAPAVTVLFTMPPTPEMTEGDFGHLRFADQLRAVRPPWLANPSSLPIGVLDPTPPVPPPPPHSQGHTRLAPLDVDALDDPPRPSVYRRLQWLTHSVEVADAACQSDAHTPPKRSVSDLHDTASLAAPPSSVLDSGSHAPSSVATVPVTSSEVHSAAGRMNTNKKKRAKTAGSRVRSARRAAHPPHSRVESAIRPLSAASVRLTTSETTAGRPRCLLSLVEREEERFRLHFEENERRARDLLHNALYIPLRRRPLAPFHEAVSTPSPARSVASSWASSPAARASWGNPRPLTSNAAALRTPPASLSVGLMTSLRSSLPPSPYSAASEPRLVRNSHNNISWPQLQALPAAAHTTTSHTELPAATTPSRSAAAPVRSPIQCASPSGKADRPDLPSSNLAASGRWLSSVLIEGGFSPKNLTASAPRRRSTVGFSEVGRILPIVVGVHREINEQDHLMASELMARSHLETREEQQRSRLEEKYVSGRGGQTDNTNLKRSAFPSPTRRFFLE